jgi:chromosome partitioning protein
MYPEVIRSRSECKLSICKTKIRDNIALADAPAQGVDIFRYNPKSYGAEDYLSLSKEILKKT